MVESYQKKVFQVAFSKELTGINGYHSCILPQRHQHTKFISTTFAAFTLFMAMDSSYLDSGLNFFSIFFL